MYSCPTDDIHSIYLDNELPLAYVKQYEQHITECPECAKKLAGLKAVHNCLQQDSLRISQEMDSTEASFAKLQTKLKYSKTTSFVKENNSPFKKIIFSATAAAAIFVMGFMSFNLFIPSISNQYDEGKSIAKVYERPNNNALSSQNVVINGNLYSNIAQNVSTGASSAQLKDVDMFRPDFESSRDYTIQIKIPGFTDNDYRTMEIKLPQNLMIGPLH